MIAQSNRAAAFPLTARPTAETRPVSVPLAAALFAALLAGSLPALLGRGVPAQVAALWPLSQSPTPYFIPAQAGLLYGLAPLVVVSSFLLFLAPGALLALAFQPLKNAAEWFVYAFGVSVLLVMALSTAAKIMFGPPLTAAGLLSFWLGAALLAFALLLARLRRGAVIHWPLAYPTDRRRLLWLAAAVFAGTILLLPKLFWENFNLDGTEALEFSRSLTYRLWPYGEIGDGLFGFFYNFVIFAFPNHWFITLFGPLEAAVRLPFLLYLAGLFAVLLLLAELESPRPMAPADEALLWLGLAAFTVVQAFSASYEPFYTDLAEPAATDALWLLAFLAAVYTLWTNHRSWFFIFGLMSFTASLGGGLLLAALIGPIWLSGSPRRLAWLKAIGGVLLLCAVVVLAYELLYSRLLLAGFESQFSAKNALRRLFPPVFTQFVRFNALLFPGGLLPALSLLAVRRKEALSFTLAAVTAIYFGVMYLQVWTSLHQFTPVMVLPLAVFWRLTLHRWPRWRPWLLPTLAVTTALALYLSLPPHFQINQTVRRFGQATAFAMGNYERDYPSAVAGGRAFYALLPKDYRLDYPTQAWGSDAASLLYYAHQPKPPGAAINYIIQPQTAPPPNYAVWVGAVDGVAVFVVDQAQWQRDLSPNFPRVSQSALYEPIYHRTYAFFRQFAQNKD
jgi:hypothetical protein